MNHVSAIDRTNHAVHAQLAFFDRNFGHLRVEAADVVRNGDAGVTASRRCFRFFDRQIENV